MLVQHPCGTVPKAIECPFGVQLLKVMIIELKTVHLLDQRLEKMMSFYSNMETVGNTASEGG